jgi:hypothetical protein
MLSTRAAESSEGAENLAADDVDNQSDTERLATDTAVSDMDWFKAKTKVTAAAVESFSSGDEKDNSSSESEAGDSDSDDGDQLTSKKSLEEATPIAEGLLTIRLRGLPFTITEEEVEDFFNPLVPEDIRLINDVKGRPSGLYPPFFFLVSSSLTKYNFVGRAFVDFASKQDVAKALKYNNREIRLSFVFFFFFFFCYFLKCSDKN